MQQRSRPSQPLRTRRSTPPAVRRVRPLCQPGRTRCKNSGQTDRCPKDQTAVGGCRMQYDCMLAATHRLHSFWWKERRLQGQAKHRRMLQTSPRRALHRHLRASQRNTGKAAPYQKLQNAGELAKIVLVAVRRKLVNALIPIPIDQNPCAHWRIPMDVMRQG